MELRPLASADFTQRHNPSSRPLHPHPFGGGVSSASSAVRLRHSRLRLLNELDAPTSAPAGGVPDDAGVVHDDAGGVPDDAGGSQAAAASTSVARATSHGADWRESASLANRRRREVLAEFRRRAALTLRQRMPVVRDVNKIDRYSRTTFPVLFVVFNVAYWVYYLMHKRS